MQTIEEYKEYTKQLENEVKQWHDAFDASQVQVKELTKENLRLECERVEQNSIIETCANELEELRLHEVEWDLAKARIKELEESQRWRKCSEELPEDGTEVLATDGEEIWLCHKDTVCDGSPWFQPDGLPHIEGVTHWKPLPSAPNMIFENETEFKAYIDGYLITKEHFKLIENELRHAIAKHPKFCEGFVDDKTGMYWQYCEDKIKARNEDHAPTAESVLLEEIAEAFNAYQHGDKQNALKEFAQCGAVIFRIMELVKKEMEST